MSTESMTTTGAAVPQAAADGVTNPKGIHQLSDETMLQSSGWGK